MSSLVPIADSTGAVTGLAFLALLLFVFVGIIALAVRSGRRGRSERENAEAAGHFDGEGDLRDEAQVEPNMGAIGLALAAVALAIVAVFLPALESSAFSQIEKNSMIQSGTGWLVLGCAVGILEAVYRVYSRRTTSWSVFVLGLVIVGAAVYDGTGDRTKLESVVTFGGESVAVAGSPGVGIYAAGAAGVLAMFAGAILAGRMVSSYQGAQRRMKVCPDCAESVLVAARVCKHCGHEFARLPVQN